jgi:2-polyprenyl-3-methyl-5-hydroxy-6-metoxy-1,4-benzoquinol methylase
MDKSAIQEKEYNKPYHWMLSKKHQMYYDLRSKLIFTGLGGISGMKVLDYGCGDGRFTSLLAEKNCAVTGADISEKALSFAKQYVKSAGFVKLNSYKTDFTDNSFDIAFCLDVIEHADDNTVKNFISEFSRILAPKGKLVISVPSELVPVADKHFRHFTTGSLKEILSGHFSEFTFYGYGYVPPVISYKLFKYLFDREKLLWLWSLLAIRECSPRRASDLICICSKNG